MYNLNIPIINKSITPQTGLAIAGAALATYLLFKHINKNVDVSATPTSVKASIKKPSAPSQLRISNAYLAGRISAYNTTTTTATPTTAETTTVNALKDRIKKLIISSGENVTVVLTNLETIATEIDTYSAQLLLVVQQKAAGVLSETQVTQYIQEIMKTITTKLQIKLKELPNSTPEYYQKYYQEYLDYIKSLNERYYDYYQPSYQYYPQQSYNYYQPYQYQYPNPYQQAGQYPYSYPNYSQQGYYNQYPGYQSYYPQYGYGGYPGISIGGQGGIQIGGGGGFSFF